MCKYTKNIDTLQVFFKIFSRFLIILYIGNQQKAWLKSHIFPHYSHKKAKNNPKKYHKMSLFAKKNGRKADMRIFFCTFAK